MPEYTVLEICKKVNRDSYHTVFFSPHYNSLRIKVDIAKNTNPADQLHSILSAMRHHLLDDIIIEKGFEDEVSDEVLSILVKGYFNERS
jgi:hypothetical protein